MAKGMIRLELTQEQAEKVYEALRALPAEGMDSQLWLARVILSDKLTEHAVKTRT